MKTDANAHLLAKWIEAVESGVLSPEEIAAGLPESPEEVARLLELATELRSLPPATPSGAFRRSAKDRLMRRITQSAPTRPRGFVLHRRPGRAHAFRPAARLVAIVALLLVFATSGTVYAATFALPGDLVYPVKGWVEEVRLQLSPADREKALRQQYAQERAAEIQALIEQGRYADLPHAFRQVDKQVDILSADPSSEEQIRTLQAALSKQGEVLSSLLETVPDEARPAIEQALDASNRSQERFSDLNGDPPPAVPPGQEDKEQPPVLPSLPPQARPNANSSPGGVTQTPTPEVTPEPEETTAKAPGFTPPGQANKDNEQAKQDPPRGPHASNGRGHKGKPNGSPGRPPFLSTKTPSNP